VKSIVYVGPFDEVETDFGIARRGERFDVPDEAAGRAPKGRRWSDIHDPGEGLLAQPDNWHPWREPRKAPAKKAAPAAGKGDEAKPAEQSQES